MKLKKVRPLVYTLVAAALLFLPRASFCAVPQVLNFQGRIVIGGTSFNGSGQFQFALVDGTGATTYWSNDGTSSGGGEPSAAIALTLTNGLYAVLLGDTNVAGMTQPVAPAIFTNADVRLRVWFNDGTHGFEQLTPDQRIASAGYALVADTANNFSGNISNAQLPGNVATTNFVISQNYLTVSSTNGLATIDYVNSATNGLVTASITNGLATTNFVLSLGYATADVTNGLVGADITNGLATTNFVTSQGYVTALATNGFVTASVTNGLATIGYANLGTNFVGTNGLAQLNNASNVLAGKIITITNGLATTNYVTSQNYVTASVTNGLATVGYVNVATNGFVTASVTNGLATIGYANLGTNFVGTNGLAQLNNASNVLAGKIVSATNSLAAPALVGAVPLVSLGNALTNNNAAPVILNGTMTNNSTVFTPTNTASFSFPVLSIKADAVLHTNFNQRAQLVGSAILENTVSSDATLAAIIRQGLVTNTFPMTVSKATGVITNAIPFNFPLNPNAVWYFTNLSGAGATAYVTNTVVIGE